jgi:hypothetical protein
VDHLIYSVHLEAEIFNTRIGGIEMCPFYLALPDPLSLFGRQPKTIIRLKTKPILYYIDLIYYLNWKENGFFYLNFTVSIPSILASLIRARLDSKLIQRQKFKKNY